MQKDYTRETFQKQFLERRKPKFSRVQIEILSGMKFWGFLEQGWTVVTSRSQPEVGGGAAVITQSNWLHLRNEALRLCRVFVRRADHHQQYQ